jgi:hypothetical protein
VLAQLDISMMVLMHNVKLVPLLVLLVLTYHLVILVLLQLLPEWLVAYVPVLPDILTMVPMLNAKPVVQNVLPAQTPLHVTLVK